MALQWPFECVARRCCTPWRRCGFLGMLHLEVFMQRLEQEHGIAVVTTTPTVPYRLDRGPEQEPLEISRVADLPPDVKVPLCLCRSAVHTDAVSACVEVLHCRGCLWLRSPAPSSSPRCAPPSSRPCSTSARCGGGAREGFMRRGVTCSGSRW